MNKKTSYTLLCFLFLTSYGIAQSDVISVLDNLEKNIESTGNQRDTSLFAHALVEGVKVFAKNGIEEKALLFFGKLTVLPNRYIQSQPDIHNAYEAIAQIYYRKKEFFIATSYIERAVKMAKQNSDSIRLLQQFCDILLLQKSEENKAKITQKLEKIDFLLKKNPYDTFIARHLLQQGLFSALNNDNEKAILFSEKAIPFFEKNKNATALSSCFLLLSQAYQKKNDTSKSLYFLQKYNAEKENIIKIPNNILEVYESRKKDKTLLFNVEKEKKQEKKLYFTQILIGVLCGILMIALAAFLIYRREKKQQIKLQNLNIQAMMNELKAFNYSVSHDLKAPLVEMFNALSRIEKSERQLLNDRNQTTIEHISQMLLNTRKMIDEMLAYSITDNQGFEPQRFEMIELIEDILYQFSDTIQAKGIDVRVAPNFPQVYGDLGMLRQVFQNLISNAIKFSQNKPAPLIQLDYKKEKERIVFSVSDNGIGFDEQYKNKLFGLFKRLPTNEKFEGIGAGLAIVKRIVERHGGEVWAEGSPSKGAVFYFSLPKLS